MTNAERYHFADFTFENYRRLIRIAKEHYVFRSFRTFDRDERFILWRHDLEFSPQHALRMAEIEAEESVAAIVFLNMHSEYYNLFERSTAEIVKKIISLGHEIGLHLDTHFHAITTEAEVERAARCEKDILEDTFGRSPAAMSFHNTTPAILGFNRWEYAGMINAYAAYFQTDVGYAADSTGFWRFERLEDRLREAKDHALQVLTHDGMWQETAMPPRQRIHAIVDARAAWLRAHYDATLEFFGAKNIDWEEPA